MSIAQEKRICKKLVQEISVKEGAAVTEKPALTIKETAHEFQFPEFAIRTLVKRGAFPVIQVGNRVYITREVFAQYLKEGRTTYVAAR